MSRMSPRDVKTVASLGAGPIGGGWAAHFLARGYDVVSYIHDMAEEAALRTFIETAWVNLEELGLATGRLDGPADGDE